MNMYNYGNYNPYGMAVNPYNNYSIQQMEQIRDGWDAKIQMAQQQNQQPQQQVMPNQPTNLTQNFQLAPQTNNNSELESRYAENIDEVKNTFVMKTGVFVTKDYSTMWIKDVSGNITAFRTEEIKELDDKDIQIQNLQRELNDMKQLVSQSVAANQHTLEEMPKAVKTTKTTKK
jgi:hypothetical protein